MVNKSMKADNLEKRIDSLYTFHLKFNQLASNAQISLEDKNPMIEQQYLTGVDLRGPTKDECWHSLLENIILKVTA
jgi:hypothetical protein